MLFDTSLGGYMAFFSWMTLDSSHPFPYSKTHSLWTKEQITKVN